VPDIALHTRLRAGSEAAYERLHARIPAAMVAALQEAGVRDWRIWRDGQDLFHLVDVADYPVMREVLRTHPANVAWQAQVAEVLEVADDLSGKDDSLPLLWTLLDQIAEQAAAPLPRADS
jgi:L-rhamnose mutarotase